MDEKFSIKRFLDKFFDNPTFRGAVAAHVNDIAELFNF